MRNPKVGYRYAKALVETARTSHQLDTVKKDVDYLRSTRHPELTALWSSPVVRGNKKSQIFNQIYTGRISPLTQSFFNLVFRKGRAFVLRDIGDAFDLQYNQIKGIVNSTITTAVPISEELRQDIFRRIANLPRFQGKTVNLEVKHNPDILGGFVLQVDDLKFDASIRHDLHFIKQVFLENLYEMKY